MHNSELTRYKRRKKEKAIRAISESAEKTSTYLPSPSDRAGYDTKSIFKWSLTGLNLEFSFS